MLRLPLLARRSFPLLALIAQSALAAGNGREPEEEAGDRRGWTPAAALLAAAADGDRDGVTDASEVSTWLARLTTSGGSAELEAALVHASLIVPLLDRNGDALLQAADVAPLHAERDADGNGIVDARELVAPLSGDDHAKAGLLLDATFAAEFALRAADSNRDGAVTRAEWDDYLTDQRSGRVGDLFDLLQTALADAASLPAAAGCAYSAAAYLETLDRDLDRDLDGHLSVAEVTACLADLDRNDDGVIDRAERSPPARYTERTTPGADRDRRPSSSADADLAPPLIEWQRDLDDALALSRASGRPLLICVNMDGEVACESLARGRYRDPEFARLTRGFVPLLASPNQHRARGHDDFGRRLTDPRFGAILDQEHIEIEPLLFARYFNRQRVAPRHVGVAPDGQILFDLFLLGNLAAIDHALRAYGRPEADAGSTAASDDPALLDDPSAHRRAELEARFEWRDDVDRRRWVEAALSTQRETQHPELVRRGLRDRDAAVRQAAVEAVRRHADKVPHELLVEAFRVAGDDPAARAGLIDAAYAWANATDDAAVREEARRLGRVFDALQARSRAVDVADWTRALRGRPSATPEPAAPAALDRGIQSETLARLAGELQARTADHALRERLAEASLDAALWDVGAGADPGYLFQDAQNLARRAVAEDPPRPRALAVLAVASHHLGDREEAGVAAKQALPGLVSIAADPLAANTLRALIGSLTDRLYRDMREQRAWPAETLTDLVAAQEVLASHPACAEGDLLQALDLLGSLRVHHLQGQIARRAAARFPGSGPLHNYLRFIVLRDAGARALESTYAEIDVPVAERATWDWFTGLAGILAAERHVQDDRVAEAVGAYQRASAWLRLSALAEPTFAATAAHYVCMADSGEARLHLDAGRTMAALVAVRRGLIARPEARSALDGLGHMPVTTAQEIVQAAYAKGYARDAMLLERTLASFAN